MKTNGKNHLSPAAATALKQALCSAYWYKSDLQNFLRNCLSNPAHVANFNWDQDKHKVVSELVDVLIAEQGEYFDDLRRICCELHKVLHFKHLKQLDDTSQAGCSRGTVAQLVKFLEIRH